MKVNLLATALLFMAVRVMAAPTAVGFGPGCHQETAPPCSEPDPFDGGYIYARCCRPDDMPVFKPPPGYSPYPERTSPDLWLLAYAGYQGLPSDYVDPQIQAAWDKECDVQHGVPAYGPKRDYESYLFQTNCIVGNGTKSEKDVTGEVAKVLQYDVLLPSQHYKDAHKEEPTKPKTNVPFKETYDNYWKVDFHSTKSEDVQGDWVVKCRGLVYMVDAKGSYTFDAKGFAVDLKPIKDTSTAHVYCWRFNKDGSKKDLAEDTAKALRWSILKPPKASSDDDASNKQVRDPTDVTFPYKFGLPPATK